MPFSYGRIRSRVQNNAVTAQGNIDKFMTNVESGTATSPFAISSPLANSVVISNGTAGSANASSNVTYDGTVFTIIGNLDVSGNITGTIESNSDISGNMDISGNTTIGGNLDVSGNMVVDGNFTVKGTTHIVDASNTSIKDALIEMNSGVSGTNTNDSGLIIERGSSGNNAFMGWYEASGCFILGTTTADATASGHIVVAPGNVSVKDISCTSIDLNAGGIIRFEGATSGVNETTLTVVDPTADHTITLPNATGTVSLITNTETLTNKTLTLPKISDLTGDHTYNIVGTELVANRQLTLPVLTGTDTFIFADHPATLTNKSFVSVDINSGSIDGVIIGAEDHKTGKFTTLTVTSDLDMEGDLDVSGNIIIGTGHAANITHTSDGAAEDFTIEQKGNVDSSLILKNTTGTVVDALQITASAGGMDITSALAMDITTSAGNTNINIDPHGSGTLALGSADNTAVTIDALAFTATSVNALTLTDGTASLVLGGTGATSLAAATTVDLDCTGIMSLNSSAGAINIGDDAIAQAINIGTGGAARTITVGNATGATAIDVNLGTGGLTVDCSGGAISLDANGAPSNFTLASTATADDLTIALTGATDSSLILSSTGTGADALQITASAGGMDITSALAMDITTSAGNTNINIDPHGSGTLALGSADNTAVTIDALAFTATSVNALTLTDGTASLVLGGTGATSLAAATTVDLDCTGIMSLNSSAGAINIGDDAIAQAINIGTGGAARTITVGNATGATAIDVNLGTGGLTVDCTDGGAISLDANGAPSNFTLASTATADDLTIALTGATDSSLILSSTGTGADALQITASAGGMDITSALAMDITTSAGNTNINIDPHGSGTLALGSADNTAVTIDALAFTATSVNALTLTDGTASLVLGGTGATSLAAATTVDLDCTGIMSLNSSAGAINIGDDAIAQAINIGTGGAARTITVGNATGATAIDVNLGTGGLTVDCSGGAISLDANGAPSNFTLASTATADDLTIALTGATDSSLILSSTGTGADALQITASAGGMDITSALAMDITTSAGNTNINIDPHGSGTLALGSADNTAVTIDALAFTATSVNALTLTDGTASLVLGGTGATSLAAATTVDLDCTGIMSLNSSAGAINIGDDAIAQAINIGTGGAARTITVGNATGATAIDVNLGTGGLTVDCTDGGAISLDANGAPSNFTLASTATADDLTIALTGATDSSLILSSTGTGADALQITASAGGMDITSALAMDITTSAGNTNINIDPHGSGTLALGSADNTAVTIDALAFTATSVNALTLTDGTASLVLGGTGATSLAAATTVDLDCTGIMSLNSSAGAINIGDDAIAQAINIGTGGAARTITVGNATGATAIDVNLGTGGLTVDCTDGGAISLDANGAPSNFTLASTATADDLTIALTGATDSSLILSSTGTGADALQITASAGGMDITSALAMDITTSAGNTNINIDPHGSGTLALGSDDNTKVDINALDIELDAGANGITINSAGAIDITSATDETGIIKMKPGTGGMITNRPVQTITDSATDATAAQYVAGFINCTGGGLETWTLPTGAALADAMPSDTVTVGDSFICHVVNASGGNITYEAGASGCTISSSGAGTLVQKTASLAKLEFIFTDATGGSELYHCLLIADNS